MKTKGYKKEALLAASALLLLSSVLVPFLGFLIWIALIPLLLITSRETPIKSFFTGLVIGTIFFSGFLYWIVNYELRIFVIVLALTIPFLGFFAWLTNWFWRHFTSSLAQIFAPPVAWMSVSFIYSLTPINVIGDQIALTQAPLFPAIVRTIGISGMAFLILLANSLGTHWITTKRNASRNGIILMFLILTLGVLLVHRAPEINPIRVALVQHNFPMSPEWRFSHQKDVMATYEKAIRELGGTADLILFPQYGLPIDALRKPERLNGLARLKNTSILLGTYIPKFPGGSLTEGERFDTALLFTPKQAVQQYRAMTPPPFRRIGQVLGTERTPLYLDKTKFGILLCYEDVRPDEGSGWVKNGAEILAALSNPGHFLETPLPGYHLLHDRIRAIETGKYLIRVSPNGFSAIIDPNGKMMIQSRLSEERVLSGVVYPNTEMTLFTKIGAVFPLISAWISLISFALIYGRASIKRFARKTR